MRAQPDPLATGEAETGAGDHDRTVPIDGGRAGPGGGRSRCRAALGVDRRALLQEVRKQVAELAVHVSASLRCCGRRRRCGGRGLRWSMLADRTRRLAARSGGRFRALAETEPGGVQAAQCLVERDEIAGLGVVREQRDDVRIVTEDVIGETLEGLLRSDLDEHAAAGVVEGAQPGNEPDRRGDLLSEDVDHLRNHVWPHRVEPTVDVGDQGNRR